MTIEQISNIVFIDIETVPIVSDFELLDENLQKLWTLKAKQLNRVHDEELDPAKVFKEKAGIFAEFSKVVCIGIGYINFKENNAYLRLKSHCESDEKNLLNNFITTIQKFELTFKSIRFCGHNIKEFDLPFLCRRMVINQCMIPQSLQIQNKKPWEINHIDTLELWKFGDYKHYISLELLATILHIPSPKNDIDGSQVAHVFWNEKNLDRISTYCLQDVTTTTKVFLHLAGLSTVTLEVVSL
jgi:DNA polymerase elongation subunit (family B)